MRCCWRYLHDEHACSEDVAGVDAPEFDARVLDVLMVVYSLDLLPTVLHVLVIVDRALGRAVTHLCFHTYHLLLT